MKKLVWLFIVIFLTSCQSSNKTIEKDNYRDIINNISSYKEELDSEFLKYIYDNYGIDVLKNIENSFKINSYSDNVWHEITGKSYIVLKDNYNHIYENSDNVKAIDKKGDITINFVGDVSLADNWEIMPYYDSRGEGIYGILSTEVVDIMRSADIMFVNNEFTVSNRGSKIPNKMYSFRANPERLSIYKEMGVDIVSIANNHAYDYGGDAFLDMLSNLRKYGISYVGGGKNIEEAKRPYYVIAGGYKIAFLSATRAEKNILTPGATENTSGVLRSYDTTILLDTIRETKKNSDYVILYMHWGREDSHELEDVQITTSKEYIDAGVDLLVGSHAHTLQGMEFYNNKLIAYNLGDFIFNRESKDTGILSVTLKDDGNMNYMFIPCKQDNFKTTLLDRSGKTMILDKMNEYSINAIFDNDGKISLKS